MKLQAFVVLNHDKFFGDTYTYDSILVHTRRCSDPAIVEVCISLPFGGWGFMDCFDSREVTDNASFHRWLTESFFSLAEESFTGRLI